MWLEKGGCAIYMYSTLFLPLTKYSHMVGSGQFLLQSGRKLISKRPPVLFPHLILKAMQDLREGDSHTLRPQQTVCTLWNVSLRSSRGVFHEATASQKNMKCCRTPRGLTLIMAQIPRKAESFSSLSRMVRSVWHHMGRNWGKKGATSVGHTSPSRPMVMAVFSSRVLGVF